VKKNVERNFSSENGSATRPRGRPLLIAACAVLILGGLLRIRPRDAAVSTAGSKNGAGESESSEVSKSERSRWVPRRSSTADTPAPTAEEIVASKVAQFGRSRRDIVRAIARRSQKEIPAEVEAFFDAIESGDWETIEARWDFLAKRSGQYESSTKAWEELNPFWSAVLDAYGVAEQAHEWPAQKLLDYGNAILSSLRPGMVYVGGTDNGRWVPELLNETSGTEPHIIVTQNALADGRYIEYMSTLYGERFSALTSEDSQRAFQDYMADAQKRLEHDQQFPDEPKQLRPGEDIRMENGQVQVSGQAAVMAINEKLLQILMQKNPDLSFAVQESSPMRGTYGDALPLGPLMELRAQDGQNVFSPERAAQSLDYWRHTAQQVLSDPEATGSPATLKSYSHDAVSAANLLAAHNFSTEAEQSYRLATQLWPENPEPIAGLAELLTAKGRANEAEQLIESFEKQYPGQRKELDRARARGSIVVSTKTKDP
jgi:hypothetical protein